MSHAITIPASARTRFGFEPLLAFVAGLVFYVSLYGELPYHDVARFVAQVESGRYVWDIAHIFLQPVTLLWHKYLGFGESAETTQKHINTFATALGLGVFYALTQRMEIVRWQRIAATLLVMSSTSIIILAPSGHMKLLAFPFVNAALYFGVVWEGGSARDGARQTHSLVLSAVFLAIAAAFLASCLATAPFATLAVLFASRRHGETWSRSLLLAAVFAAVCGLLFIALACFGFIVFTGQPLSLAGLATSVEVKAGDIEANVSIPVRIAREVFGTANNFIGTQSIGIIGRAWLTGAITSIRPYVPTLLTGAVPLLATSVLLAAIYLRTLLRLGTPRICLMLVAFLCGAQAWSFFYSLNDPEHWFQQTVPTVLLFLTLFGQATVQLVLPLWAAGTLLFNLWAIAIPQASYPLLRYQAELHRDFGPKDLLIYFAAYPGGAYLGFFKLDGIPNLALDLLYLRDPDPASFFSSVDSKIAEARARGGRVVIFGVLDPMRWDAPWTTLAPRVMTKPRLFEHFQQIYTIRPIGEIAEIPAWEITP
jgi:hypothetical protein